MSFKRYNGTSFVDPTTVKRYDGTNWVDVSTVKRWNGTEWITVWAAIAAPSLTLQINNGPTQTKDI